ncbi:hypothetical protein D9758_017438 [Tetrapyrgos nigripes]|uniref:Cytochrome P450 n=1 Tax=Tetrapyrgos nigripes TaxID=182062 RepID=A0A8H5C4G1_9AGAR|nr:hypothetical protein D9758_017438 [Tetrapyrgos nigripes]
MFSIVSNLASRLTSPQIRCKASKCLSFPFHLFTIMPSQVNVGLILFAVFLGYKLLTQKSAKLPFPPGPKGLPILGSAFSMPTSHVWIGFNEWAKTWGPIMSFTAMGARYVLVSDYKIADEMLGKTGSEYADRPSLEMAKLSGWDRALSLMTYGDKLREYRKLIGRVIGTRGNMSRFDSVEEYQANMFVKRVLDNPTDAAGAIRKTAGAMILHLTYGYKIQETGVDPLVNLADEAMADFGDITRPGAYIVELFPFLRNIPAWFPFFSFKKRALECIDTCNALSDIPFAFCEQQLEKGEENNSFCAALLKDEAMTKDHLNELKWAAASFYAAGSDTVCRQLYVPVSVFANYRAKKTVSVIYCYFLACCIYPDIQRKAQAEVDRVVGKDRLPTLADRDSLPYVAAVIKELYRWLPIIPLAVPHRATRDTIYKDYFIPKGTDVIVNVWKYLHDPVEYPDPFTFNPERFFGPNPAPAPHDRGLFGYGRRICPGIHLPLPMNNLQAEVSVFINVVKAVAALQIQCPLDANGKPIVPTPKRPVEFKCTVKPRSQHVVGLLEETLRTSEV